MQLTAEELAIYGLIDADTYIRITEALIAGTADAAGFQPTFSAKVRRRIRQRAETLWRQLQRDPSAGGASRPTS